MDLMELKLNELVKENKKELIEDIKGYISNEFAELMVKNYHSGTLEDIDNNTADACSNIINYLNKL